MENWPFAAHGYSQELGLLSTTVWVAILGGLAAIAAAVIPPLLAREAKAREARAIINKYRDPLLRSAHDLQRRLYRILRGGVLEQSAENEEEFRQVATSTVWLFGQYLGWVEILHREAQPLDLGTTRENRRLQDRLTEVASTLAGASQVRLAISEAEQQAIGEAMIEDVTPGDKSAPARPLSYGEFQRRSAEAERIFHRWSKRFEKTLRDDLGDSDSAEYNHLAEVQRTLVDLVDILDPDQLRFPRRDDRAKVPGAAQDDLRRETIVARFEEPDLSKVAKRVKKFEERHNQRWNPRKKRQEVSYTPDRWFGGSYEIAVSYDKPWLTIRASTKPWPWIRLRAKGARTKSEAA